MDIQDAESGVTMVDNGSQRTVHDEAAHILSQKAVQ
jgi:hypothetical protein